VKGYIYILDNPKARRVKVGMSINSPELRLKMHNDHWLGITSTCQICLTRRLTGPDGRVPKHNCRGAGELPLERDTTLAREKLEEMKAYEASLGKPKKRPSKRIQTFERRIPIYETHFASQPEPWVLVDTVRVDDVEAAEKVVHQLLSEFLDTEALIGEVFICSVEQARKALSDALETSGLDRQSC